MTTNKVLFLDVNEVVPPSLRVTSAAVREQAEAISQLIRKDNCKVVLVSDQIVSDMDDMGDLLNLPLGAVVDHISTSEDMTKGAAIVAWLRANPNSGPVAVLSPNSEDFNEVWAYTHPHKLSVHEPLWACK